MSAFSAAAQDEDGDIIRQLREENEQLRQSLQAANYMLVKVSKAGAHYARAASCLRETVIRWAARAEQAEEMLEAIGAGGVGKMEQPQTVTDCHQSQPKGEPLTDTQINDRRIALAYDSEDLPDPWDFKQGFRAAERAHGTGGEA